MSIWTSGDGIACGDGGDGVDDGDGGDGGDNQGHWSLEKKPLQRSAPCTLSTMSLPSSCLNHHILQTDSIGRLCITFPVI